MANSAQGIYAPLPQSISDSESEKELHMDSTRPTYLKKPIYNGNTLNMGKYKNNVSSSYIHMSDDLLKIKQGHPKMSTMRKVAFIASIILCFLPIVIFIWVLPCSASHTCPIKTTNWENKQDDIALKGNINLVPGVNQNNLNLAVLFEGSVYSPKALKHGAISYLGNSGTVAWYF